MRYCADHKAQTRERLLSSSGQLAKQGGFAVTGVDALMKSIGLTGAAFYSHFSSKDELFAALIESELQNSVAQLAVSPDASAMTRLRQCLSRYLSASHANSPEKGCVLPALGAEIARASEPVRQRTEHQLQQLQAAWAEVVGDDARAWALLAQCLGSLMLARMMASDASREEVLNAGREACNTLLSPTKAQQ